MMQKIHFRLTSVAQKCCSVRKELFIAGLCSSRAWWHLVPNVCAQATRKSQIFHTNHMLGTLDFTVSEHWGSLQFSLQQSLD